MPAQMSLTRTPACSAMNGEATALRVEGADHAQFELACDRVLVAGTAAALYSPDVFAEEGYTSAITLNAGYRAPAMSQGGGAMNATSRRSNVRRSPAC